MCKYYQKKKPRDLTGKIHILIGEDNCFLVDLKENEVSVKETDTDLQGDLGLTMSKETLYKLVEGKWNGMTAAGRSNWSESTPLDFRLPEGTNLEGENLQMMYHFLVHFFSNVYPTVTQLGRGHSRKVHGGNAVPIAYGHGIRYAYYTISKGQLPPPEGRGL
ncbi:MAG: SCP2 sterol-binding domain-containing protein [Thermoplasmata archaeon]